MFNVEILGFIGGGLVSIAFFPQVLKSWRTKSTHDVSILLGLINLAGQSFWIAYGVIADSISLVIMSCLTFIMSLALVCLKLKYK